MATTKQIGIIGSKDVARALGKGLTKHGFKIMLGTRDPKNTELVKWAGENQVQVGTNEEAAKFGQQVIIASQWAGTENAIKLAGAQNLKGKIVMDCTNPLKPHDTAAYMAELDPAFTAAHNNSAGESVQKWLPDSHVVKVWNSVGSGFMIDPPFKNPSPTMFICGNDDKSKAWVEDLLKTVGWQPLDLGAILMARVIEPLCPLWCCIGAKTGNWAHAFADLNLKK